MRITFLGATGTVTGSKYLVEADNKKILIDCGLFQGLKELRLRNWERLPIDPHELDAVLLTHAHIDHSGYLPLLVKNGFKGKIYCSKGTYDLCEILLPDSGHLQEEEAKAANKYGFSKHKPAKPLYTKEDALNALEYFSAVDFGKSYYLTDEFSFHLSRAGHIIGSSFITLKTATNTIVFSGDIGRPNDPIMKPPAQLQRADYLILESTYGDRLHEKTDPLQELSEIINATIKRGGSVIIPSFAVGRAQMILYYLYELKRTHEIPDVPIYVDSPMATSATKVFYGHAGEHRLSKELASKVCHTASYCYTPQQSMALDAERAHPKIIISASGMATGGRVLYHLKAYASNSKNTILFVGYQAAGTRGARMVSGEKQIKLHGEYIDVKAQVIDLANMSAHADYAEILNWLKAFQVPPRKVFITHGEPESSRALKEAIETQFKNWQCVIPEYLQSENL